MVDVSCQGNCSKRVDVVVRDEKYIAGHVITPAPILVMPPVPETGPENVVLSFGVSITRLPEPRLIGFNI